MKSDKNITKIKRVNFFQTHAGMKDVTNVSALTVAVRMKKNALDADVQLSDIFTEHEMFADSNFPCCRVVRQKLRPYRPVNDITHNFAPVRLSEKKQSKLFSS